MGFPEVASVFAKAGRAETATDPAPLEMVETVINLKPPEQWRAGLTPDKLIAEMNAAMNAEDDRLFQQLDHADQGPHRHALHRHSHAGGREGVWPGS